MAYVLTCFLLRVIAERCGRRTGHDDFLRWVANCEGSRLCGHTMWTAPAITRSLPEVRPAQPKTRTSSTRVVFFSLVAICVLVVVYYHPTCNLGLLEGSLDLDNLLKSQFSTSFFGVPLRGVACMVWPLFAADLIALGLVHCFTSWYLSLCGYGFKSVIISCYLFCDLGTFKFSSFAYVC